MGVGVQHQLLRAAPAPSIDCARLRDRADFVAVAVDDDRGRSNLVQLLTYTKRLGLGFERPQHVWHHHAQLLDHGQLQKGDDTRLHDEPLDLLGKPGGEVHGADGAEAASMDDDRRVLQSVHTSAGENRRQGLYGDLGVWTKVAQGRLPGAPGVAAEFRAKYGAETAPEEELDLAVEVRAELRIRVKVHKHALPRGLVVRRRWRVVEPVSDADACGDFNVPVEPGAL
mmetsp:Transcript_89526/g.252240  ORF Transcript_89526/g.252240 Transcript_89526/m.252240 type:complete len:227 (+) Transcript_89526:347-1027(+)